MTVNSPRAIKRRCRRSKAEIQTICDAIYEVLDGDHPQSVRHVFYRLCSPPYDLVPKDEAGYNTIKRKLLDLRDSGDVPWAWVSDGTRWRHQQDSYNSPAEAVRATAEFYRRDLWKRTPVYVEVWCESDSIAGVLIEETDRYNVPLMVSRGFSSRTFLYHSAVEIERQGRPAHLYYIGDWDPSGKLIPEHIEATIKGFAPAADIEFTRLLVTPQQIKAWGLPTKPPKKTTHARGFKGGTVEAEAIPASRTRQLVRDAIEQHLDLGEVRGLRVAEDSEAQYLHDLADVIEAEAAP